MPYKDPERKKEWERLHRSERLARRRELRHVAPVQQVTRPDVTGTEHSVGFLIPLVAGGALAAYSPKLGMGAPSAMSATAVSSELTIFCFILRSVNC